MKRIAYPDVLPALTKVARIQFEARFGGAFVIAPTEKHLAWLRRDRAEILARGDVAAGRYGPVTREVAREYGYPLDVTRRQLVKALAAGTVLPDGRGGNRSIRWWPFGLAAELQETKQ
jgi:hypothetical protein